jgi:hypothetical protein
MKCIGYIATLLLSVTTLSAQEIKLKKDVVYVDEKPTFSYVKKAMGNELYIYKLNSKEEVFKILSENNATESKVDDSKKIVFTQPEATIQNKNFQSQKWDFLLQLILKEHVIDPNGIINPENLKRFKAKYDEKNTNHTMMR